MVSKTMGGTAAINIRVDRNTKLEFEKLCRTIGLSMSSVFNVFVKQCVKEQRLPLDLSADSARKYNAETLKALEEVERMDADPSLRGKGYTDVDEMLRDILGASAANSDR